MSFKSPRVDPKKTYVMKRTDKVAFVSQLTPMLDSDHVGNARRFGGKWLNDDTCWRWWTYHVPVEVDEAIRLYAEPVLKRITRKRKQGKRISAVRKKVEKEFKPHAKHKKLRSVLKKVKRRR